MERIQMPFISFVLLSRFSFESYKIKKNIGLFLTGRSIYRCGPAYRIVRGLREKPPGYPIGLP
jgi:hypothetical protein